MSQQTSCLCLLLRAISFFTSSARSLFPVLLVLWPMQTAAQVIPLDPPPAGLSPNMPPSDASQPPSSFIELLPEDDVPVITWERDRGISRQVQRSDMTSQTELLPLRPGRLSSQDSTTIRLVGETTTEQFILFLPQVPDTSSLLQIRHRSGIDALPSGSSLSIMVNGRDVGEITPRHFDSFAIDSVEVPPDTLRAGRNLVDIKARHMHRIACGAEASFALWTEIDASNSGIAMSRDLFDLGPTGFIAALMAQTARGAPVTFHRPDADASMTGAAPYIAQLAAALGGIPPEIVSTTYWSYDVPPQLARITAFAPGAGVVSPQFRRGGDGALVLLVEQSDTYSDILASLLPPDLQMVSTGPPLLRPGSALPLSELGVSRLRGEGRYVRFAIDFALPWDWLLLASQNAQLDLDYRFPSGLPEGALLLVKVNGATVRMLPLDRGGGQLLPTLPISFRAKLLQPGVNRLEFEALIPGDPPDRACPQDMGPTLEISEGSRLYIPRSPSMAQPSIDRTLAMIAPDNIVLSAAAERQLPRGFVPQLAATLLLAPPDMTLSNPEAKLTVGVPADLEQIEGNIVASEVLREILQSLRPAGRNPAITVSPDTPWEGASEQSGVLGRIGIGGLAALPGRIRDGLKTLAQGDTPPLRTWLTTGEGQLVLIQPDLAQPDQLWLIVAPGVAPTEAIQALAASRMSHDGPRGQVALYAQAQGWQNWTSPDRPLILLEPMRLGSLRMVMGNFATTAPLSFIGTLLGLSVLSAFLALAILALTRTSRT